MASSPLHVGRGGAGRDRPGMAGLRISCRAASCHRSRLSIIRSQKPGRMAIHNDPHSRQETRGKVTPMEAQLSTAPGSAGKWSPSPDAGAVVKSVHAMLHPRNIVLVDAHDKPGNYAERILTNSIKYNSEGALYPVNAKREPSGGVPCSRNFSSLPEKPDHVLVLVPARFTVQVIREAAAAGARSATIGTSGFSELRDDDSQKLA